MSVTKKFVIYGRVQGVGFRYAMCSQAADVGVTGTVMNREDGNVEAVVQGTEEQLALMLAWAKKGPSGASVNRVEVSDAAGVFSDFSIVY